MSVQGNKWLPDLTFSFRVAPTDGKANCWSIFLEAIAVTFCYSSIHL